MYPLYNYYVDTLGVPDIGFCINDMLLSISEIQKVVTAVARLVGLCNMSDYGCVIDCLRVHV